MNINIKQFTSFLFTEVEPSIGLITLNRPGKLNAITFEMLDEFSELFQILSREDSMRVVILTGGGRGFCSGADLKDASNFLDSGALTDPESFLRIAQEKFSGLVLGLRKIPQTIIAAVNGVAAGGGFAMTLASDFIVASPDAYFIPSFINIGLSGGEMGTSYFLPRFVGLSRATEILCTGRNIYAEEAQRIGLVVKIVPQEELIETALSYAKMMTSKSIGGLKLTKRVLEANASAPSLEAALNLENRNQAIMAFSGDFAKFVKSFVEGKK